MGRKLDNWSFGLSLVGFIGGFLFNLFRIRFLDGLWILLEGRSGLLHGGTLSHSLSYIYNKFTISPQYIFSFLILIITLMGLILGIMALIKNPEKRWKPILAITLSILMISLFMQSEFQVSMT